SLKTRWDKFIFGQPVETEEFIVGLLRCLERLFEQAGSASQKRKLSITAQRQTRKDWLEMNYDAVTYFSRHYRGLRRLTAHSIDWQVGDVFTFERLVQREQERGRFQQNQSVSKAANQIKFYVELECTIDTTRTESYWTQMTWHS